MSVKEQWVPMSKASKELGVSTAKLSQMAKTGEISSKKHLIDKRITLVDIQELKTLFGLSAEGDPETDI